MADPRDIYTPIGPEPEFLAPPTLAETEPGFGEYFGSASGNVVRDSPTSSLFRISELNAARATVEPGFGGEFAIDTATPLKRTHEAAADAFARAKAAGVTVDFGTAETTREAVDIMIDRARRRAVRDGVVAQYKPFIGTHLGVSLLTSLADPLNIGAAFIPFAGQARYATALAGATGFGGRTAVRAGMGAVEGFGGAALVEPLIAFAATQEGRDYTMADSMLNLMFGAGFGGGLHVAGGTVMEKVFKRTYSSAPVETPADIIDRLPPEMREAGLRGAVADIVEGRPVASAELVTVYSRDNPAALGRSLTYAESFQRGGPAIDDTVERIAWWEARLAGQTAPSGSQATGEKPIDFAKFIKSMGGIRDTGDALRSELGDAAGTLPRGTLISDAGSRRTERGLDAERVIAEAINQGYVADRAEFVAMLKSGGKGVLRQADRQTAEARADDAEYTKRMLAEAKVNPSTRNSLKARAIVGTEQSIVASERAQYAAAVTTLENRFLGDTPPPKVEPLPPPGSSPMEPTGKLSEADALSAETDRRFAEIAKWLPPEKVAEVQQAIDASRADLEEFDKALELASLCALGL